MAEAAWRRVVAALRLMARGSGWLKSILSWAVVLALVLAVQLRARSGLFDAGQAPEIRGEMVGGAAFAGLRTLPKPAVVYFWASWCGICKLMQGTLSELAKDVPMITVATQSGDRASVHAYMLARDFTVPAVPDEEGSLGQRYGVKGVPALFILDREGKIRFATTGYTSEIGVRLRLWLAGR